MAAARMPNGPFSSLATASRRPQIRAVHGATDAQTTASEFREKMASQHLQGSPPIILLRSTPLLYDYACADLQNPTTRTVPSTDSQDT